MPYVSALADFREKVRDIAREEKGTCILVHAYKITYVYSTS